MTREPKSSILAASAAVLAFTPGVALVERFAFREHGIAAANEIEAMERRGEFRSARPGVGVPPDVEVPADEALTHAHRLALEAILKDATGVRRDIAEEGLASLDQPQD